MREQPTKIYGRADLIDKALGLDIFGEKVASIILFAGNIEHHLERAIWVLDRVDPQGVRPKTDAKNITDLIAMLEQHASYQRPPDLTQGDSHERRDLIQWHQGKGGFDGSKDYAQRQVRRRASPGSGAVPGWESGATDVGDCPGSGWG